MTYQRTMPSTDVVLHGVDSSNKPEEIKSTSGALNVDIGTIPSQRNYGSANGYSVIRDEVNMTRVTTIGSDVTISSAPAHLVGIIGEEASTTIVLVKDGAATVASLAAGAIPLAGGVNFHGARCETSLVVNVASTGKNLLVLWRPI